jgi:TatD DNase family protein
MLIDAHSHVDRYDLVGDHALESAIAEIAQHRILTVSNSMDGPSYKRTLEIGKMCDWVVPIFGVHPWNAPQYVDCLRDCSAAIESSPMIGEIGLDHFFVEDSSAYAAQRKVFEFFLSAAREQNKIVNVHTKGAERDVLELLDRYQLPRAIVHWYSGPLDAFRELVARKAYFTVGIEVLYSEHIQTIAQEIPSGQLLTETDNPGGPQGFIGRPGTPVLLKDVLRGIADARKTTIQAVVDTVQANLGGLIRGDPWLENVCGKANSEFPMCMEKTDAGQSQE